MKTVGVFGGSTITELGPIADVQLFFDCIESFAIPRAPERDWALLTDRLYRRYLRPEEMAPATELIALVKEAFDQVASSAVDWSTIASPSSVTRLDPRRANLGEVFGTYFEAFEHSKQSAELLFTSSNLLQPVRILTSDLPAFIEDKKLPLETFDALDGQPLWKRRPATTKPAKPAIAADPTKPSRAYRATERFEVGQRIEHPTFGEGVVELSEADKITVCFATMRRVLSQAKLAATGGLARPKRFEHGTLAGTKPAIKRQ